MIRKKLLIIAALLIIAPLTLLAKEYEGVRIFTAPPDVPYKELGNISSSAFIDDAETIVVNFIASSLKVEASKLGANGYIITNVSRHLRVYEKNVNYDINPFLMKEHLSIFMEIKAVAIKTSQ